VIALEAVRLVNWYHFVDQTFRMGGSCLLLGDNGCGKSTVLDAIQLALVADLNQVRFNKAANEHSRRNLYGYVRCKLGSEDESRPGQVRFLRGGCTSYVLLQFSGPRGEAAGFTAGVVLEASEADTSVARWHCVLPGALLDQVPLFAEGEVLRTAREFRGALRDMPQARLFPDPATYREELRHRLGPVPEDFHRLIVKALDFRPIGQIRQFVFDYLLDERPVDTAALQANLENYKKLEGQSRDAEQRLAALDRICDQGERIAGEQRTAESHQYLYQRAEVDIAAGHEQAAAEAIEANTRRQTELQGEDARNADQRAFLEQERDRLDGLLLRTPGYQEIRRLEGDLEAAQREAEEARDAEARARDILAGQAAVLETLLSQDARDLRQRRRGLLADAGLLGAAEEPALVARLHQALVREGSLQGRDLGTWTRKLDESATAVGFLKFQLERSLAEAKREGQALQAERADLERGRQRYPEGAEALLHLLRSRLKGSREPAPLCELIEVPGERWRNAVEGYLNTRRFDVIVAPEDFPRALSLYERHKASYPLPGRGEVFIAGVGLVDIERVRAGERRAERRSLAEQVRTEDPLARAYVDSVLGDVICCENEQELRKHRTAITDTVMVYRNHVARQTPPEVYRRHYIGEAARVRRLDEIDRRLRELSQEVVELGTDIAWLGKTVTSCTKARSDAVLLPGLVEQAAALADLTLRVALLQRQLQRIDRSELDKLEVELVAVKEQRSALETRARAISEEQGRLKTEIAGFAQASRTAQAERLAAEQRLTATFGQLEDERRAALEERYHRERASRAPEEVREIFERQHRTIGTRIANLTQELVSLKTAYVNAHGFVGETLGEGYAEFLAERDLWRDSRLPEYQKRITKAKEEAIQQLAEDIIFRLRENLVDVRRQVDELNRALKDVPFGAERYQFTLEVAQDHRDFYDLIMEAGAFERDSIFGNSALANPGTRKTLDELFARLIQAEARQVKTELEARADYREYFDYDLKIHHADGTWSLYDRVAADKSGGETQNPYYIAIFASLFRLYRRMATDGDPTCGLILLDEAFSKMDEWRIAATLRFARELGLQLVLATPKERSELVAPWVETSLYIHRDPQSGAPTVLDFTKEFTRDDHVGEPGPPGSAA